MHKIWKKRTRYAKYAKNMRKYAKKNAKMCNKYAVYVGSALCIVYIQNMDRGLVIQVSVCADAISRAAPAGAAEPEVQLLSLRLRLATPATCWNTTAESARSTRLERANRSGPGKQRSRSP